MVSQAAESREVRDTHAALTLMRQQATFFLEANMDGVLSLEGFRSGLPSRMHQQTAAERISSVSKGLPARDHCWWSNLACGHSAMWMATR